MADRQTAVGVTGQTGRQRPSEASGQTIGWPLVG